MPLTLIDNSTRAILYMGPAFALVGLIMIIVAATGQAIVAIIGAFFLLFAIIMLAMHVRAEVTIDETRNALNVKTTRCFLFKSETTYNLTAILGAELLQSVARRGHYNNRLKGKIVLHRSDGVDIDWQNWQDNMNMNEKIDFVNQFNTYLSNIRGVPVVVSTANPGFNQPVSGYRAGYAVSGGGGNPPVVIVTNPNQPLLGGGNNSSSNQLYQQYQPQPQPQAGGYGGYGGAYQQQMPPPNGPSNGGVFVSSQNPYANGGQQPSAPPPPYNGL